MKALLIINPASGRNQIGSYVQDILSLLRKKGYIAVMRQTRSKDDAKRFVTETGESCELIVCCGGDGTLSEVTNGVMALDKRPAIAYIPTGTTNDFSKNMGLSSDILKSIISLNHGRVQELDIGLFEDKYFIYVASFGLFAESSYATPRNMKMLFGHLAYMIIGTKELFELRSYRVRITADGEKCFEDEVIYGSVSNSSSIGGLMCLNDKLADLRDGMHEVVLIRRPKRLAEFNDVVRAIVTGKNDSPLITVFSARELTVECETPLDWSLDGEHERTEKTVTIRNLHRAVRLIFPKTVSK